MPTLHEPRLPSVADIEVARTAVAQLRDMQLGDGQTSVQLRAVEDGTEAIVDMLSQLASGHAVTIVPVHAELTTQQAADMLNVSRPFLISLLESGKIGFHRVGNHRRIRFQDLMEYRRTQLQESKAAMADLAADAQRWRRSRSSMTPASSTRHRSAIC